MSSTNDPSSESSVYVAPTNFQTSQKTLAEVEDIINGIIKGRDRWQIKSNEASGFYWHIEAQSKWWRFKDDFEIHIRDDPTAPGTAKMLVDYRSASRIGTSDYGKNKDRVDSFKGDLEPKI